MIYMANKVIKRFQDKESNEIHNVGDLYEHESAQRVAFLVEKGFLEAQEVQQKDASEFPKHVGGGHYELSNGEKVKGKEEAAAAEKELSKEGE
jgi:hypothetical protein